MAEGVGLDLHNYWRKSAGIVRERWKKGNKLMKLTERVMLLWLVCNYLQTRKTFGEWGHWVRLSGCCVGFREILFRIAAVLLCMTEERVEEGMVG